MQLLASSRLKSLTISVNHVAIFEIADLRILAIDPDLTAACGEYARSFYPRSTLARVAS